jgi:hypothetical protein
MHSYILDSEEFAQGDYGRALFNGFLRENKAMKGSFASAFVCLRVMSSALTNRLTGHLTHDARTEVFEDRGEGRGGTTATVALVTDKHRLFVANVGDSRSVLARDEGSGLFAIRMSRDHNLEDKGEYKRFVRALLSRHTHRSCASQSTDCSRDVWIVRGVFRIAEMGVPAKGNRVYAPGHSLNMTRALGDFDFKAPYNKVLHST